jgi:uncharacterized protein (TIGR00251 family)
MTKTTSDYYHWEEEDLLSAVHIQPGASKDKIVEVVNGALKIRITAPPEDGKANSHLIKYLAKIFGVSKSSVNLIAGNNNRHKRLRIQSPVNLIEGISRP